MPPLYYFIYLQSWVNSKTCGINIPSSYSRVFVIWTGQWFLLLYSSLAHLVFGVFRRFSTRIVERKIKSNVFPLSLWTNSSSSLPSFLLPQLMFASLTPIKGAPWWGLTKQQLQIATSETHLVGQGLKKCPLFYYLLEETLPSPSKKNLAHYNTANPGSFVVAIQTTPNGAWKILTSIPDDTLPSLTLYNLNVVLPAESSLHAVLQVQYISNAAPGTFYQCADISLGKV